MNRTKANKLLQIYGRPALKFKKSKKVLVFAKQSIKEVEEIEKMDTDTLIQRWKNLVWTNQIYGQVSLNDMQRIQLMEMEMDTRKGINKDELTDWFEEAKRKFNVEEFKRK